MDSNNNKQRIFQLPVSEIDQLTTAPTATYTRLTGAFLASLTLNRFKYIFNLPSHTQEYILKSFKLALTIQSGGPNNNVDVSGPLILHPDVYSNLGPAEPCIGILVGDESIGSGGAPKAFVNAKLDLFLPRGTNKFTIEITLPEIIGPNGSDQSDPRNHAVVFAL